MPTIISTPVWSTEFALNLSVKQFLFTDSTNYAAASIPLSGVRGDFTITSPSGVVVYNNTSFGAGSDIVANISLDNAIVIPLPNLSNQAPQQGTYIITYTVQINDGVNPIYYISATHNYVFKYVSPVVCITEQVDCIQPLFTSTDTTNYIVNGITPLMSRTMTLDYPANSGGTPITNTTSATITTSTFYTGLQAVTVSSDLLYTVSTGFYIRDLVQGTRSINVDCAFICNLVCCLNSLNNRVESARGTNSILFDQLSEQFEEVMAKVQLLLVNIDCGKQQTANRLIREIKVLANCTNDCNCTDGTPSRVTGLGNINNVNVVVQSGGTPITITSNTVAGITTYTVSFDQALVTKINNSYNTVLIAGSGITITPSGIISDTQTYTVSSNYIPSNNEWFRYTITNVSSTVTGTISNVQVEGTNMQFPTVVEANTSIGGNLFTVSAFQISGNNTYKVFIEPVEIGGSTLYLIPKTYDIRVVSQTSNDFKFQFTDLSGNPLTDADILTLINSSPISSIVLNILIKA